MVALSVLDLSPVPEGSEAADSFRNSADLARHAEALGYTRYWLAEHHNMPGVASAATSVVIGHVAAATKTIRVGAGGVMLPNHAPLIIAEQFGTLASLFPDRIDLGLGRAPGTDGFTAAALRRGLSGDADGFVRDVMELQAYFAPVQPGQHVRAVPGAGLEVPIWILGSSLFGAQVAAALGLPYAFASHFAPAELDHAVSIYRERFKPSAQHEQPYVIVGANVTGAETDEEAQLLFSSVQQSFVNLRSGRPGKLPPPLPNYYERIGSDARAMLDHALACAIVGSPQTVEKGLAAFIARTGADEVMVTANIYDHAARVRSFEIAAAANRALA